MPAIEFYLRYYLIFITALTVFYLFGNTILRLSRVSKKIGGFYTYSFFSLLTGLIAFITIYSIAKTGFKTVNTAFLLIGGMIFAESRNINNDSATALSNRSFSLQNLLTLLLASLCVYSWLFFSTYKNGKFSSAAPGPDYLYYSNISYFLSLTGQENKFHVLNLMDPAYHGPRPFHFFELWLNAGISEALKGLNIVTLFLTTFPILYFLSFLGFLAVSEHYGLNFFTIRLAFLSLFLGGVSFGAYSTGKISFLHEAPTYSGSLMSILVPKLSYYYAFILGFYCAYLKNQKTIAFLILLGLAVASISAYPALLIGSSLFYLLSLKYGFLNRQETKRLAIYTAIIMFCVFLFYALAGLLNIGQINSEETNIRNLIGISLHDLFTAQTFRHRFNNMAATFLNIALIYAPFILLFMVFCRATYKIFSNGAMRQLIIASALVIMSGMLVWLSIYKTFDGMALFYHISVPLMNCFVYLIMLNLLIRKVSANKSIFRQNALVYLFIFVCFLVAMKQISSSYEYIVPAKAQRTHDGNYIEKIKAYIADKPFCNGFSIKDKSEYITTASKYTTVYVLGSYLPSLKNGFVPVSLSDFSIGLSEDSEIEMQRGLTAVSMGIFYQFVQRQKKDDSFESIEQSQVQFIDRYKIKYGIVSKRAEIPLLIKGRVKNQFEDSVSGERFLILE